MALSAGSFSDTPGDDNAAPDITSVAVSQSASGPVSVVVGTRPAASPYGVVQPEGCRRHKIKVCINVKFFDACYETDWGD